MFNRFHRNTLLLVLGSALFVFIFYGPTDNWNWDPSYYYAQLRSPVIDQDFDFRGETLPLDGTFIPTEKGLQPSPWPVGPGLLWAPFFLVAHVYTLVTHPQAADGTSAIYIGLVSAGSALLGLIGVLLTYKTSRYYANRFLSLMVAILVLIATPLFFYIFRQPVMAHSTSFLASASLLLSCVLLVQDRLPLEKSGIVMGAFVGLNVLLRWSSVLLAIVPIGLLSLYLQEAYSESDSRRIRLIAKQFALFGLFVLIVVSPQLAEWRQLSGHWLVFPTSGFSDGNLENNFVKIIFSTNRGIIYWLPFAVIGFIGLVRLPDRKLRIPLMVYLGAFILLLSFWKDWYGGGGYGARYFIETLPVAAIGFAALFREWAQKPPGRALIGFLAAALMIQQFILMITIEQGANLTWVPLHTSFIGGELGVRFQLRALRNFIQHPNEVLIPRPVVGPKRQSILVSLLTGRQKFRFYIIPLIGLMLIPTGLLVERMVERMVKARWSWIEIIPWFLAVYMLAWFVYFVVI